jgi:hypothetical protein
MEAKPGALGFVVEHFADSVGLDSVSSTFGGMLLQLNEYEN